MGAPKPTLGYPSRTAAVLALSVDGRCDSEIADRIGIEPATVGALRASAARARPMRPAEQNCRTVLFPIDTLERLRPHADRRGISANELARRLIDTAVDEGMVDAILDDLLLDTEPT